MSTLVSGGRAASAITSQLSKPTTATSSGTASPISRSASTAPRAIWSLPQKSASGAAAAAREEILRRLASPGLGPAAGPAIAGARLQPRLGQRLAPAHFAQANRLEPFRSGDMGDPPAAESGEMADRKPRAALVVRQEAKRVGVLDLREHIDHRQAARGRLDRRAPVGPPRGDDEAVDALAEQLIDMPALAHGIVGGVAHEDGDAVIGQAPLERLDDRKREAAEAVVGENADRHRARPMQALRQIVRPVVDRLGDPR